MTSPVLPSDETLERLERSLGRRGRYTGPITEVLTPQLIQAVQRQLADKGFYTGSIGGVLDLNTAKSIQKYAKFRGQYTGAIDGNLTEAIWETYLEGLRRINQRIGDPAFPVLVVTTAPVASGSTAAGSVLTTTNGTWNYTPDSTTYVWTRDGVAITGATSSTYTSTGADIGHAIGVTLTVVKSGYSSGTATTNTITVTGPLLSNTTAPAVTGTAKVGQTLTVSNGSWSSTPDSYTYVWKRGAAVITGATASTYVPVSADVGAALTATVTAVKANYASGSATSAATAAVSA